MIEIVPATMEHARRINLRPGDAAEIAALGVTKEEGLRKSLDRSLWAETYFVDGEPAAIMGVVLPCLLGRTASPWLMTSPLVEREWNFFLRHCRIKVGEMLAEWDVLMNYVHADYRSAVRWLRWLRFTIDPPLPIAPQGALFHRFHMERV